MIIRWVCSNCNKKWIYPVKECVYCKGNVKKQKGSRLKVVGITKVNVPSVMHPIVPYYILLLEDEFGNKMPKKGMKEYKIGDDYIEESTENENAVSVVRDKYDIYETVKHAIGLVNGFNGFDENTKIIIKPSITFPAYPYQAATTNPDVVKAVVDLILEKGARKNNIVAAEQSFIKGEFEEAAAKSGIMEVCKNYGIDLLDASKGEFNEINFEGHSFRILKDALERLIINIPVMKTNQQIGISGGIENLIRLGDAETQKIIFENDFDEALPKFVNALLGNSKKHVLTIGDATTGMEGQGPTTLGEPAFLNWIMASKNAVALDSVFCDITMLKTPKYIEGFNSAKKIEKIEVVGNEPDALRRPIKKPEPSKTAHPDIGLVDGKACNECFYSVINLTSKLAGIRGERMRIAIGPLIPQEILSDGRLLVYGGCAIKKLNESGADIPTAIRGNEDFKEQVVLLRKLLTSKGELKITPIDRLKSKFVQIL